MLQLCRVCKQKARSHKHRGGRAGCCCLCRCCRNKVVDYATQKFADKKFGIQIPPASNGMIVKQLHAAHKLWAFLVKYPFWGCASRNCTRTHTTTRRHDVEKKTTTFTDGWNAHRVSVAECVSPRLPYQLLYGKGVCCEFAHARTGEEVNSIIGIVIVIVMNTTHAHTH